MKKKIIVISLVGILLLPALLIPGCRKTPVVAPDTFTSTYNLAEGGRSISISGDSEGVPGERSQYMLNINNNKSEPWHDEYCVELINKDSLVQEIYRGQLDLPGAGGMQQPITVSFPEGFVGALGLCVIIPQRACTAVTLSAGEKDAIPTGWYDLSYLYNQKASS
jgi:hypothetical protein